jgi:hypothetical protein
VNHPFAIVFLLWTILFVRMWLTRSHREAMTARLIQTAAYCVGLLNFATMFR